MEEHLRAKESLIGDINFDGSTSASLVRVLFEFAGLHDFASGRV